MGGREGGREGGHYPIEPSPFLITKIKFYESN